MPDEFSGYLKQEETQKQAETAATVPDSPIRRLKQEHPEYQQLSDTDLADRMYKKHYKGKLSEEDYYQRMGVEAPSALKELAPSAGYGLREGAISNVLGMGGGLEALIDAGITSADAFIRRKFGMDPVDYEKRRNELPEWAKTHLPTPQDIDQAFGWEDYNPRTRIGRYVKSVAEMLPAFIAPEETLATKLTGAGRGVARSEFKAAGTKAAVPAKRGVELLTEGAPARLAAATASGVGAEAAGELTDNNPWARALGGGLGGFAAGAANVERTAVANRTRLKDAKVAAQQGYDFLASSTHPIGPLEIKSLGDTTEINLEQMGYREITAPRTWRIIDKELKEPPGGVTRLYGGGAGQLPSVPSGHVRFFHGGEDPASGGPRWVTTDPQYARDFRAGETPNQVHYVDIPKGDPAEVAARAWDAMDEQAGTNMVGRYNQVEMPEHWAQQMRPYEAVSIPSAVTTQYPGQLVRRVQDLVSTHEALGKIRPSAESMSDFEAAQEARAGIRKFLQSLPDKSISKTHKDATANWAQFAKERDLREAVETAENRAASTGRGNNYQNTIRQEVRKILEERIARGGLLAGEEAAMRAITRGTHFENVVRVMSSFAPWDLHRGTAVALIGGFTGGWPAALAVGGAGAAMQMLGKALNKRDMRKLLDRIQENAPVNYRITPANRREIQRARNLRQFAGARGAAIGAEQGQQAHAPPRITVRPQGSAQEATPDLPHEASNLEDDGGDLGAFATRGLSGVAERHGINIPGTSTMRPIAQAAGELPMGGAFSGKEMALLRQLVQQKVPWREIARQFPGRRLEALQMQAYRVFGKDMPQRAAGPRRPGFEEQPPPGMEPGWSQRILDEAQ